MEPTSNISELNPNTGKIKDKYHFCHKLAAGGFGVVYLAEDRKTK